MALEANFVTMVGYLKFKEQNRKKQSKIPHGSESHTGSESIFVQPNFDKHTNLYKDFYNIQVLACAKKHGLSPEKLETFLFETESNQNILNSYNAQCHFPFIGLVREKGPNSFDGAASLAQPSALTVNLSKNSPQSLKAVLTKYYTSLLYKMTNQLANKRTTFDKFCSIV